MNTRIQEVKNTLVELYYFGVDVTHIELLSKFVTDVEECIKIQANKEPALFRPIEEGT